VPDWQEKSADFNAEAGFWPVISNLHPRQSPVGNILLEMAKSF